MRRLLALLVVAACAGGGMIENLKLSWRGVDGFPQPSAPVARSLAAAPIAFGLRDARPDPSVVGRYEDTGFVVRTTDDVARYCSARFGEMLMRAGARLNEAPAAVLNAELLDYLVIEGDDFNGVVRMRMVVRRGDGEPWSRIFVGKGKRWGRTHNPENYNEALSNALADIAQQLVQDEDFARALLGGVPDPALSPPPAPPRLPPGPQGA